MTARSEDSATGSAPRRRVGLAGWLRRQAAPRVGPFLVGFVPVTLIGLVVFATAPRVYDAAARLVFDPPEVLLDRGVLPSGYEPGELLALEQQILTSGLMIDRVIERLALDDHPEFQGGRLSPNWRRRAQAALGMAGAPPEEPRERLTALVRERFSTRQVGRTYVIEISAWARSEPLSRELVTTLMDEFITASLERRVEMTRQAHEWLAERLHALGDELRESEEAVVQFRADHQSELRDAATGPEAERARVQLRELERTVEANRALLEALAQRLQDAREHGADQRPDARVIDLPIMRDHPTRPSLRFYVLTTTALAVFAGMLAALVSTRRAERISAMS